jgi:hypothetical protein
MQFCFGGTGEEKNLYSAGSGENAAFFPAHAAPFMAEKKTGGKKKSRDGNFFCLFSLKKFDNSVTAGYTGPNSFTMQSLP